MSENRRFVCNVGTSPLPIVMWMRQMAPIELTLVSSAGTRHIADRIEYVLRSKLPGLEVFHLEVTPDVPFDVFQSLRKGLGGEPRHIFYGTGTVPMSTMLYEWWLVNAAQSCHAYYGAAHGGIAHRDDGAIEHLEHGTWTIRDIAQVNLDLRRGSLDVGTQGNKIILSPTQRELEALGSAMRIVLDDQPVDDVMANLRRESANLQQHLGERSRRVIDDLVDKPNPGLLLELATAVLLRRLWWEAGMTGEVNTNVRFMGDDERLDWELDVVGRYEEHLTCVSCGSGADFNKLRHKHFEVSKRAPELGGSEARSLAVLFAKEDHAGSTPTQHRRTMKARRKRLSLSENPLRTDKSTVVSARELFGDDPMVRLCATPADLIASMREHDLEFYEWLIAPKVGR